MKNRIAIINIVTSNYIDLYDNHYRSFERYFLPGQSKEYFVFTDKPNSLAFNKSNVQTISIKHEDYPFVTLNRYKNIFQNSSVFQDFDKLIYSDTDMIAVDYIFDYELFYDGKDLFGVIHPWHRDSIGPFESNEQSTAYIPRKEQIELKYIQGCFWGGETKEILKMIKLLYKNVEKDLNTDIIAVWHDESHLNYYSSKNSNTFNYLSPGFAFPGSLNEDFNFENINFKKKLIHINENSVNTLNREVYA